VRRARARGGAPDDEPFAALEALYREIDARQAEHACPASTECCRFGVTGREPYVTSLEVDYVLRALAMRGGRLPAKRPPPLERGPADASSSPRARLPVVRDEGVCPLLGPDGRCVVYAARPLGCRTFFCDRASTPNAVSQRELNVWVRAVKDLSAGHAPRGDEGRPLTRVLQDDKRLAASGVTAARAPGKRR
jgi:Fe-S-cluster containining protein